MKLIKSILPWVALWAAFVVFGAWVRHVVPWRAEYVGTIEYNAYDYYRYFQMLANGVEMIFYAAFRHPFYGVVMSPVILFASTLREAGDIYAWGFLIAFFGAVMTAATWFVVRVTRLPAAGALFASFASTWILAATPESFGLSCLVALATLWWAQRPNSPRSRLGWAALAALAGAITSTQGVKTAIAYLVANKVPKRVLLTLAGSLAGAGALVVVYFVCRVMMRDGDFSGPLNSLFGPMFDDGWGRGGWAAFSWIFFSEPLVTRGEPLSAQNLSWRYSDFVRPLLAVGVLALGAASAWIARRETLAKLIGAMFLVDVAIHLVLRWGLAEAQIYGGHWAYAIPVLAGLAVGKLPGERRRFAEFSVYCLAACVFAANVSAFARLSFLP